MNELGDHEWEVQERDAQSDRADGWDANVDRVVLQPRERCGDLSGAGIGGEQRGVPQVRVRGLHEALRWP